MSRVPYTPIGTSDVRAVGPVNAILDDLSDASAAVDAENLAEEGLDRSVYQAAQHAQERARVSLSTRTAIAPQAWGALAIPTNLRTGNLGALDDGSVLRVRSLLRVSTTISTGFGFPPTTLTPYEFRHVRFDGAAQVVIDASRMSRGQRIQAALDIRQAHGDMLWESWIVGPVAQITWIEVQYQHLGAATVRFDLANLTVDEFKRVRVF